MTKLKIGAVEEDKPVTLTIKLPAGVHRDLAAYAEILAHQSGQPISEPTKLIAPMLARFMATDRAFGKLAAVTGPCLKVMDSALREASGNSPKPDCRYLLASWRNTNSGRSGTVPYFPAG